MTKEELYAFKKTVKVEDPFPVAAVHPWIIPAQYASTQKRYELLQEMQRTAWSKGYEQAYREIGEWLEKENPRRIWLNPTYLEDASVGDIYSQSDTIDWLQFIEVKK